MTKQIRWSVRFTGRVQGVGFRYHSCQVARDLGVQGYVKNLRSGQVELIAEGNRSTLRQLVEEICEKTHGHVEQWNVDEATATGEFSTFDVRF